MSYPLLTVGGYGSGFVAKLRAGSLHVAGEVADMIGAIALRRAASEAGVPVRVGKGAEYHPEGTLYHPSGKEPT